MEQRAASNKMVHGRGGINRGRGGHGRAREGLSHERAAC